MKKLSFLVLILFSISVFAADPGEKPLNDPGPDDAAWDYDNDRGDGGVRPDEPSGGFSDSPWGDVYGDRGGDVLFIEQADDPKEKEKQQGWNPPKEGERRPQPGEGDPISPQQQGFSLFSLFGCDGLFLVGAS